MNPKKIYLNPKTLDGLKATDGEGKTMRVKTFASKNDAEYTDLSQVWHDPNVEKPEYGRKVVMYDKHPDGYERMRVRLYTRVEERPTDLIAVSCSNVMPRYWAFVVCWAYYSDLMPKGGGE